MWTKDLLSGRMESAEWWHGLTPSDSPQAVLWYGKSPQLVFEVHARPSNVPAQEDNNIAPAHRIDIRQNAFRLSLPCEDKQTSQRHICSFPKHRIDKYMNWKAGLVASLSRKLLFGRPECRMMLFGGLVYMTCTPLYIAVLSGSQRLQSS